MVNSFDAFHSSCSLSFEWHRIYFGRIILCISFDHDKIFIERGFVWKYDCDLFMNIQCNEEAQHHQQITVFFCRGKTLFLSKPHGSVVIKWFDVNTHWNKNALKRIPNKKKRMKKKCYAKNLNETVSIPAVNRTQVHSSTTDSVLNSFMKQAMRWIRVCVYCVIRSLMAFHPQSIHVHFCHCVAVAVACCLLLSSILVRTVHSCWTGGKHCFHIDSDNHIALRC